MGYYFSPYRKEYHTLVHQVGIKKCPFCSNEDLARQTIHNKDGVPIENEYFRWIINYYPYSNAHTLIVPKRHITSFEDQSAEEILSYHHMKCFAAATLQKLYPEAGIEIFFQYGKGSRMSLPHIHSHVVPALPTDQFRGLEKHEFFEALEEGKEKIIMAPIDVTLAREDLIEALADVLQDTRLQ
jgi:diadenosine tetraphosphate (Ap4A) HIT family hydrolase